jgi:predicted transcriptional regulator
MGSNDEIRRHAKKAMDITDDKIDAALDSLEMDGFLHKDGDDYSISSKGVQIIESSIDSGMKVQLVCLECRTVFVKEEEAKIVKLVHAGLCSLCKGKLMWEPLRGLGI